jgi:hypothetical protein
MPKTVMIVEDHELNMKLFHDVLEAHGYHTICTRDGFNVLDLARKHHPDLILMDIQLPEVSGLVVPECQCPHPRRPSRRRVYLQDAADDSTFGKHVVIVVVPLARRAGGRCARRHYHGGLGRFFSAHLSFFCRKCLSQSLRPISATRSRSKSRSVPFVMVPEESRLQPVGVCVTPLRSIVN